MKNHRFVLRTKTNKNDDRVYFEDESNQILYVFGPSLSIRQSYEGPEHKELLAIDFDGGPYIGVGDEVLKGKFARKLGLTYENNIPILSINYEIVPADDKYDVVAEDI